MNPISAKYNEIKTYVNDWARKKDTRIETFAFILFYGTIDCLVLGGMLTIFVLVGINTLNNTSQIIPEWIFNLAINSDIAQFWMIINTFAIWWYLGKYITLLRFMIVFKIGKAVSKAMMKFIDKLDMYYWRKHKTSSPLTENIAKIQNKIQDKKQKLTKRQAKFIGIAIIVILIIIQLGIRVPSIIEDYEIQEQQKIKQENDLGKIGNLDEILIKENVKENEVNDDG